MRASPRWPARTGLVAVLAAGGVLGAASPAFATDCSGLQAALSSAVAGSTVTVDQGAACTGPFILPSAPVTLEGAGSGATIDGGGVDRALVGVDVGATTIRNLTFRNGSAPGPGGAVWITGDSAPTFDRDRFYANTATGYGGALYVEAGAGSGTVTIVDSSFGDGTPGNANRGDGGGGLAISSSRAVAITHSTFDGNSASREGGGALVALDADVGLTVTESTFAFNAVVAQPGASEAAGGGLRLVDDVPAGAPAATLRGNRLHGNTVTGGSATSFSPRGGGLAADGVAVTSTADRVYANTLAAPAGPGVAGGAGVSLRGCAADGMAGHVLTNAVVTANSGAGHTDGAGIDVRCATGATSLTMLNSTVSANQAPSGTPGVSGSTFAAATIYNTIVAGNLGEANISGFGTRTIQFSDVCGSVGAPTGAGNFCAAPALADPGSGDVYQWPESPTVDAGSNALVPGALVRDYEGAPRVEDGDMNGPSTVDVGADERPHDVDCSHLAGELSHSTAFSRIIIAEGLTCTGSYQLPPHRLRLEGGGMGATIDAAGAGPALHGADVDTTEISNLTFINGVGVDGGAISITGHSTPRIEMAEFYGNSASGRGGAVYIQSTSADAAITVNQSLFGDGTADGVNVAGRGGGLYIQALDASVSVNLSYFAGNRATDGYGGGMYIAATRQNLELLRSHFTGNRVDSGGTGSVRGGGAYIESGALSTKISQNLFDGNELGPTSGQQVGAGLEVVGQPLAAVIRQDGNLVQRNTTLSDSPDAIPALVAGGGEAVTAGVLSSVGDRFVNNAVGDHLAAFGLGLAVVGCGSADLPRPLTLINTAIVANESTAPVTGSGLYAGCGGGHVDARLADVTISTNAPDDVAGLAAEPEDTLDVTNSILAAADADGSDIAGFDQRSIVFSDVCVAGATHVGAGNICKPPLLLDTGLQPFRQSAGSPTRDAGSNALVPASLEDDVEGNKRVRDGNGDGIPVVDMGAHEAANVGTAPAPPAPQPPLVIETGGTSAPPRTPPAAPPEQVVAGVKQTGGTKKPVKKCGDRTGPTSRFLNRLSSAAKFTGTRLLTIRGAARFKKCKGGKAGRIKLVRFTVKLVEGDRCRYLTKRHTLGAPTSCRKRGVLLTAKGTTRWSMRITGPLPSGRYLAQVEAVDNLGNRERRSSHRNFRHFRIEGSRLRQGWHGSQPDDYTKRG